MGEKNHIGEQLKQERIAKGYTLDDLQQLTKIQKHYLIAIEENNLDELPGDFFVKAFIRQYAEVLEMDVDESAAVSSKKEENPDGQTEIQEPTLPTRSELKRSSKETNFNYSSSSQSSLPTFLMVLFLILVLGMIWFYFYFIRSNEPESTNNNSVINQTETVSSEAQTSETVGKDVESAEESAENSSEPSIIREDNNNRIEYRVTNFELPNQLLLEIDTSGNSWVQVTINESVLFEGTISAGSSQEIEIPEDAEEVAVRIGYLPSTSVLFGDEEVEKPEDSSTNQTQTLYFTFE